MKRATASSDGNASELSAAAAELRPRAPGRRQLVECRRQRQGVTRRDLDEEVNPVSGAAASSTRRQPQLDRVDRPRPVIRRDAIQIVAPVLTVADRAEPPALICVRLRQLREPRHRTQEPPEHPRMHAGARGAVVGYCALHRLARGREQPSVIDEPVEHDAASVRGHTHRPITVAASTCWEPFAEGGDLLVPREHIVMLRFESRSGWNISHMTASQESPRGPPPRTSDVSRQQ